jgi:hypothetical protein
MGYKKESLASRGMVPNSTLPVPLENLEMLSGGKGIIFPLQFMGNVIPQPDHEGETVGGPG